MNDIKIKDMQNQIEALQLRVHRAGLTYDMRIADLKHTQVVAFRHYQELIAGLTEQIQDLERELA